MLRSLSAITRSSLYAATTNVTVGHFGDGGGDCRRASFAPPITSAGYST